MSWSPDLFIGELRPWPDSVHVVRGKTDEARRYTPERKDGQEVLERRIDELCAEVERLHADQAHWELGNCPSCPNVVSLQEALEQNAKLRQQLADVTESVGRVEERCAKLREYAKLMHDHIKECCDCCDEWYCSNWDEDNECCRFDTMMRVCGIEVDA